MTKYEIRKDIKTKREKLEYNCCRKMSNQALEKLFSLEEYIAADTIYMYVATRGEVDTKNLIMQACFHGKEVAVPKIEDGVMNFYSITSFEDLSVGYFGILEPNTKKIPKTPDIVIVPGVAFSKSKERLGYGGGFYDRFFYDKHTNIIKIALSFEFQILEKLPVEEHDIKMDMIITEKRIIR